MAQEFRQKNIATRFFPGFSGSRKMRKPVNEEKLQFALHPGCIPDRFKGRGTMKKQKKNRRKTGSVPVVYPLYTRGVPGFFE